MSNQSEAKEKQGYVPKFEPNLCGNCSNLKFNLELPAWMQQHNAAVAAGEYTFGHSTAYGDENRQPQNLRCGIGGFAVKKQGSCGEWKSK